MSVVDDVATPVGADDWDSHWGRYSDANERNPAQEYRRRLALRLLEAGGAPTRLLDIGSGQGAFLAEAAGRWPQAELLGLEVSATGVAQSQAKIPRARFRVCDLIAASTPLADEAEWATHAVCSEVLEHVDDPVLLVRHARSWMAPGCRAVFTVPGGPMSAFDRHIGHRRHFTPGDLAEVLSTAGLEVLQAAGAGFPFFNVYRGVVIARGERLATDVSAEQMGLASRVAMAAFRPLLRMNLPRSRYGWQTYAVAREPGSG